MRILKRFKWKVLFLDELTEPESFTAADTSRITLNPDTGFVSVEEAEHGLLAYAEKAKGFHQVRDMILVEIHSVDFNSVLQRKHCGGLQESLATTVHVTSLMDVAKVSGLDSVEHMKCSFYTEDKRMTEWENTYMIRHNVIGVLGFSNGPLT